MKDWRFILLCILAFAGWSTVLADSAVGSPKVSVGVNDNGAASLEIPISIPKGGNFDPKVSLSYSSLSSSYGHAGYGFNISGISVITSGGKNMFYDQVVRGADYVGSSSFYLDGKRLILKSGLAGWEGAEYVPEGDPFTTVTLYGNFFTNNISAYFKVRTREGITYTYGNNTQSKLCFSRDGRQRCAAWYLTEAKDKYGNTINYAYTQDSLCVYPASITYGTHPDNTQNILCSINFSYSDMSETCARYLNVGGVRGKARKKLTGIVCSAGRNTYRSYSLAYNETDDNSNRKFCRLNRITEYNGEGESLPSVQIDWNYLQSASMNHHTVSTVTQNNRYDSDRGLFLAVDLNADGYSDIVRVTDGQHMDGTGQHYTFVYVSRSSVSTIDGQVSYPDTIRYELPPSFKVELSNIIGGASSIDFDGDGINDLIFPYYSDVSHWAPTNGAYYVIYGKDVRDRHMTCHYTQFALVAATENPLFASCDLDGDGKEEVVYIEKQQANNGKYYSGIIHNDTNRAIIDIARTFPWPPKHLFTGDYNGDGLADLIIIGESRYKIYYNNGYTNSLSSVFTESNSTTGTGFDSYSDIRQGDFNGDGLVDFIGIDRYCGNLLMATYNGDETFDHQTFDCFDAYYFEQPTPEKYSLNVIDLDNDGISDVVVSKKNQTKWYRSTGLTLELYQSYTNNNNEDQLALNRFLGDFDGDGAIELANYGSRLDNESDDVSENTIHIYKSGSNMTDHGRISKVTDGFGVQTSITYKSLTNPDIYTPGISHYPVNSYTVPIPVVSQLQTSATALPSSTQRFHYGDLRIHIGGKGLLGFNSVTRENETMGTVETTTINEWDTTRWLPLRKTDMVSVGGDTSTSETTYSVFVSNINNTYFVNRSFCRTTDFDGFTTSTLSEYDSSNGEVTLQSTSFDEGSVGTDMHKTQIYDGYTSYGNRNLPTTITTTQRHSDDDSEVTYTTHYEYNALGDPITVISNYGSSLPLTKAYTYDHRGNVTSKTTSGGGIPSMVKNYVYDSSHRDIVQENTAPSSSATSYTYDIFGNQTATSDITDPSNVLTTYNTYDGWGRKIRTEYPDGNSAQYLYKWGNASIANGKYHVITIPTNAPWERSVYDAFGREISSETRGSNNLVIRKNTTYNSKGQVSRVYKKEGQLEITEEIEYDSRGRKLTDTFSTGQSTSYAYSGRSVTTTTDNRSITKTYDAWGNVKTIVDPLSTVSYTYNSHGKPSLVSSGGTSVSLEYDEVGNRISLDDPDAGTLTYEYDAAGRIVSETDGRGITTNISYDALGRTIAKQTDSGSVSYTYGTSGNNANRLVTVSSPAGSINYTYDALGNVTSETRTMSGMPTMTMQYGYIGNRLGTKTYPDGFTIAYDYDRYGFNSVVTKGDRSSCLWGSESDNGLCSKVLYGGEVEKIVPDLIEPLMHGGQETDPDDPGDPIDPLPPGDPDEPFHPAEDMDISDLYPFVGYLYSGNQIEHATNLNSNGLLHTQSLTRGDNVIARNTYSYNAANGNLTSRSLCNGIQESFAYDSSDRLTNITSASSQGMHISYAANGNISSKTGIGSYEYDSARPHAVTAVDNTDNLINSAHQSITYNDFGKVSRIEENGYVYEVFYGPDETRWKSVLARNDTILRTTIYFDDYECVTENGITRNWHDVGNGVLYLVDSNGNEEELIAFTDHQGSILSLIDLQGNEKFSASYDCWGRQTINCNTLRYYRGYTGHEMIPEFGLINMNGRMYDPLLGRFLSPDNYVQEPDNSQNFNRYSYCLNNPLKYTDPSGEVWWLAVGAVIGGAINWAANGCRFDLKGLGYFGVGALATTVGSCVGGGIGSLLTGGKFLAGALGTSGAFPSLGILPGMAIGSGAGAVSGFITGAGNAWIGGANFINGIRAGLSEGCSSALIGGITGGILGGIEARSNGANIWTGKSNPIQVSSEPTTTIPIVDKPEVTSSENITLNGSISVESPLQQSLDPELIVERKLVSSGWPEGKGTYSVYYGVEPSTTKDKVRYIGITSRQPEVRFQEHYKSRTIKSTLHYRTVGVTGNFSRTQARILEQTLINYYGLARNEGQLVNLINSISPHKWGDYSITVTDFFR